VIKRLAAAVLLLAFTTPLYADFHAVARAIGAQRGVKRIWIPFLGFARTLVRVADPNGVHDFQLAVFEGRGSMSPSDLRGLMQKQIVNGFRPLVQVYSRKSSEWTFIYARPSRGNRFELMILSAENDETVLVRVDVDGKVLAREMNKHPKHVTTIAGR
jgi:hypothetical protein